jgi:hypothetical protein
LCSATAFQASRDQCPRGRREFGRRRPGGRLGNRCPLAVFEGGEEPP